MTPQPAFEQQRKASQHAAQEPQHARSAQPAGAGLPRFLQRRALKVDSPQSPLEREADAVAEQVMRMPDGAVVGSPSAASGADDRPLRRAAQRRRLPSMLRSARAARRCRHQSVHSSSPD
jgi:hypothetical protein